MENIYTSYCQDDDITVVFKDNYKNNRFVNTEIIDFYYGPAEDITIDQRTKDGYIAPTVQNVISTKLCEMLKMDNVEQIKCEIKSIINYINFGCNKD